MRRKKSFFILFICIAKSKMSNYMKLICSSNGQDPANYNVDYLHRIPVRQLMLANSNNDESIQKILTYLICLDTGYVRNNISNINSRLGNNRVTFEVDSETLEVEIPVGLYNPSQLDEWIKDTLILNGMTTPPNESNGYEIQYPIILYHSSGSGKVTISISSGSRLILNQELSRMLGFGNQTIFESGIHKADSLCDMRISRAINIKLDICRNVFHNENVSSVIGSFVPTRFYGEMMNISPITKTYLPMSVEEIGVVNIQLVYQDTNQQVVFDNDDETILNFHIIRESL